MRAATSQGKQDSRTVLLSTVFAAPPGTVAVTEAVTARRPRAGRPARRPVMVALPPGIA